MPRRKEERERPLYRVNVMLDPEQLDRAKKKAVEEDVRNVANVADTSRFLRWLVERYIDEKLAEKEKGEDVETDVLNKDDFKALEAAKLNEYLNNVKK